jgi:hypothetical protein
MFNYNQYGDDCFFGQSGDDFANEYARKNGGNDDSYYSDDYSYDYDEE